MGSVQQCPVKNEKARTPKEQHGPTKAIPVQGRESGQSRHQAAAHGAEAGRAAATSVQRPAADRSLSADVPLTTRRVRVGVRAHQLLRTRLGRGPRAPE
eukprot:2095409-Prymnesium_polylepis.1